MTAEAIHASAPAKINLTLHVTGRRPDGYHLLDSLVVFTALGDELTLQPGPELSLRLDGRFADRLSIGDNLVLRAARLLRPDGAMGVEITLVKELPVAAGIGGGSADAAAALRGLERLWKLKSSSGARAQLALRLGADVPACLISRPLRMRGIGERIEPLSALPEFSLVLVAPPEGLETAEVFTRLKGRFSTPPAPHPEAFADLEALLGWLAAAHNDLEAPARQIAPVIDEVLAALRAQPAVRLARMSGSGATAFGICARLDEARAAAAALRRARPGWWVAATAILPARNAPAG